MTQNTKIVVAEKPSNSKGWARYSLRADNGPVIRSRTGNEWVSTTYASDSVPKGEALELTVQVQLKHGRGRTERRVTTTRTYRLRAVPEGTARVTLRPGSQGVSLAVEGAIAVDTDADGGPVAVEDLPGGES